MNDLRKLFRRGILCNSPDFTHEKQPDGRYQIRLNRASPVAPFTVTRPASITLFAYETNLTTHEHVSYGPATWVLIPNNQEITRVGQYKPNPTPPDQNYFQAGVEWDTGFQVAPNYVGIFQDETHFVQLFARHTSLVWSFEITGLIPFEATVDLNTGSEFVYYVSEFEFGFTVNYIR